MIPHDNKIFGGDSRMKETRRTTKCGWTSFFFWWSTERCFVYIQRVRFLQLRICQRNPVLIRFFHTFFVTFLCLERVDRQNLSREPGCYKVFPHLFCHVFMFGKGLSSIGRICQGNPVLIRFFHTFFIAFCMFGMGFIARDRFLYYSRVVVPVAGSR